ncbi:hypothetical protein ANCCEY_02699 [Ancylostoma ceylanicum]|uniref:Uncharacterized protein n=1 Tax=Ancylostoma ceylanicum TaxID=53326 RepID=A0A0D6M717_9BILA|nr:hypothetical protein ANCCEY_02699 [Ancylostoma ceylanicum]
MLASVCSNHALASLKKPRRSASKAGLDMATRCFAKELGQHGIRINCVNPTVVMTDLGKKNLLAITARKYFIQAWSDPNKSGPLLAQMPISRFAEVEEVVSAVMFLLSDAASMTTGLALPVDGGFAEM